MAAKLTQTLIIFWIHLFSLQTEEREISLRNFKLIYLKYVYVLITALKYEGGKGGM